MVSTGLNWMRDDSLFLKNNLGTHLKARMPEVLFMGGGEVSLVVPCLSYIKLGGYAILQEQSEDRLQFSNT